MVPLLKSFPNNPLSICKDYADDNFNRQLSDLVSWFLTELIITYGFPSDWIANRIRHIAAPIDTGGASSAIGIFTEKNIAFAIAIITSEAETIDAAKILSSLLEEHPYCTLGLMTNGFQESTEFYRKRGKSNQLVRVPDFETYKSLANSVKGRAYVAGKRLVEGYLMQEPLSKRLENVFFEAHSHIRDIDGLHADEALDELCKVLYTKLYDEEITKEGFPLQVQRAIYGTSDECAASVRALYVEANKYDVRVFSLRIPGYKRSRGVFTEPITLSTAALVKVIGEFEKYDLSNSPVDIKGRAFQNVFQPSLRAGMGQYFTPRPVIDLIVDVIDPEASDLVLDPFSGSGHFLTSSLLHVKKRETRKKLAEEFLFHKLHGIEKSERMVRIAMTDMRLHGDGHSNLRCTDALLSFDNYHDIEPESFDIVMTNPPFGSTLGGDALNQLAEFDLKSSRNNVPLEVLGLERCVQFLRPGGKLAIVLPESIFVNSQAEYVRDWIKANLHVRAIISLPIETFTPHGANIKTCILFARKWLKKEMKIDFNVYFGVLENIGYDASGKDQETNDVNLTKESIKSFFSKENWT